MQIWLNRDGKLVSKPTVAGIPIPKEKLQDPVNITKLSNLVYVLRFDEETDAYLAIFRKDISLVPRLLKLHGVQQRNEPQKLAEIIFSKLLSFDNNRLGNRDRNIALPIIRPLCGEFFRGHIQTPTRVLSYSAYKTMLTLFAENGEGLLRVSYVKLSRSIKDNL